MSQRVLVSDDHDGTEITLSDAEKTLTNAVISRNGEVFEWDGANLTDESWKELSSMLAGFFTNLEATHTDRNDEGDLGEDDDSEPDNGTLPLASVTPKTTAASSTADKPNSKDVRAWWYGLSVPQLRALALPTPKDRNRTAGKMPETVTPAYIAAHKVGN